MIDRIGTLNHSNVLLNEYQRIQSRIVDTQTQIATGKVGDTYADVENRAGVLSAAKAKSARTDAHLAAAKEVETKLGMQDVHLQQLAELSDQLREAISSAVATGRAETLMEAASGIYKSATAILNSQIDGVYIYGGTRTNVPPVNAASLDDLMNAPAVSGVFENTQVQQTQAVEEGVTMETGMLASDLGTDLFQMLQDIAVMNAGPDGPFASALNPAQKSFLETKLTEIPAVSRELNTYAAINGTRYNQVQDVIARHEDATTELAKLIGDIEDTDVAAAITRLNQDQAAQQAAARIIANLQENSLLNFLN